MRTPGPLLVTLASLLLVSCIDEFDTGRLPEMEEPNVVVTCFLHRHDSFQVDLEWSRPKGSNILHSPVTGASAYIYEDDDPSPIVLHELGGGSSLYYNHDRRPKYGSRYRLVVDVPGYGRQITAETSIPDRPSCKIEYAEMRKNQSSGLYYPHFTFSELTPPDGVKSLWITGKYGYEDDVGANSHISRFFPNTADVDHVNMYLSNYLVPYTGSNMRCDFFVRIPAENLREIDGFNLCTEISMPRKDIRSSNPDTGQIEIRTVIVDKLEIDVISPSEEYDRYCRSAYKQYGHGYDPSSPFIDDKTVISGNINNGLGIFAGYAYDTGYFSIDGITRAGDDE